MKKEDLDSLPHDVYLIICIITQKRYVGITSNGYLKRWKWHLWSFKRNCRGLALYSAMKKYGIQSFVITKIDEAKSLDEALELEKKYIVEYKTQVPYGYNISEGGFQPSRNFLVKMWANPEKRKRQSELKKEQYRTRPELRELISKRNQERFKNEEERRRLSQKNKEYWNQKGSKEKQRKLKKELYDKKPELKGQIREGVQRYYQDNPEAKNQRRIEMKQYRKENPEITDVLRNAQIEYLKKKKGEGVIIIGGKSRKTGQPSKKLIEAIARGWHKGRKSESEEGEQLPKKKCGVKSKKPKAGGFGF